MKDATTKSRHAARLVIAVAAAIASACSSHESDPSGGTDVTQEYAALANCGNDAACNAQAAQALHDAVKACIEEAQQCKAAADGGDTQACRDELRVCVAASLPPLPPCLEELRGCVVAGGQPADCVQDTKQCLRDRFAAGFARDGGIGSGDDDDDGGCDHSGRGHGHGFFGGGWHH